ncbi:MAG: two-component hybrid sensor and regulator [Myxococcales bacterium]|nr:two-component hybrid sensor and regulator [Myxococcales bacterium]
MLASRSVFGMLRPVKIRERDQLTFLQEAARGIPDDKLGDLRALLDQIDSAAFMIDPVGRVVAWSQFAEHMFGYSRDEAAGLQIGDFYSEQDREQGVHRTELRRALTHGRIDVRAWRLGRDDSKIHASVMMGPVRDPVGGLRGFALIVRKIDSAS